MKRAILLISLILLAACQSTPRWPKPIYGDPEEAPGGGDWMGHTMAEYLAQTRMKLARTYDIPASAYDIYPRKGFVFTALRDDVDYSYPGDRRLICKVTLEGEKSKGPATKLEEMKIVGISRDTFCYKIPG